MHFRGLMPPLRRQSCPPPSYAAEMPDCAVIQAICGPEMQKVMALKGLEEAFILGAVAIRLVRAWQDMEDYPRFLSALQDAAAPNGLRPEALLAHLAMSLSAAGELSEPGAGDAADPDALAYWRAMFCNDPDKFCILRRAYDAVINTERQEAVPGWLLAFLTSERFASRAEETELASLQV